MLCLYAYGNDSPQAAWARRASAGAEERRVRSRQRANLVGPGPVHGEGEQTGGLSPLSVGTEQLPPRRGRGSSLQPRRYSQGNSTNQEECHLKSANPTQKHYKSNLTKSLLRFRQIYGSEAIG